MVSTRQLLIVLIVQERLRDRNGRRHIPRAFQVAAYSGYFTWYLQCGSLFQ